MASKKPKKIRNLSKKSKRRTTISFKPIATFEPTLERLSIPDILKLIRQQEAAESHPDVPIDDHTEDIVFGSGTFTGTIPDPTCDSGKRKVTVKVEMYRTMTVKGKMVKDPAKNCGYKADWDAQWGPLKARIIQVVRGDCVQVH